MHTVGTGAERLRVVLVGAGVVGRASGMVLSTQGCDVVFVDVDASVRKRIRAEGFEASSPEALDASEVDVFLVAVPTYTETDPEDGLRSLETAVRQIGRHLRGISRYAVVAIRSTILPGTTEDLVIPTLETTSGLRVGTDFGVCVNPEFLREESARTDFLDPPTVVIGESDGRAGAAVERLYGWVKCPIHRVSLREAEMQKFVHNVINAAKISLFNELRDVCMRSEVDDKIVFQLVCESAESMRVPSYGTLNLGPFGGSCLPKDTRAFLAHCSAKGLPAKLVRAVLEVNADYEARSENPLAAAS